MNVRLIGAQARVFSVILLYLLLGACDEDSKSQQQSSDASVKNEDAELLKDLGRAGPELERRLLKSVSIQDGLVIVHDPLMAELFTYVLPTNSPWMISCGVGLTVTFGNAVSGDQESTDNEVKLHLATTFLPSDACAVLAPQLGKRLKAMLQEHLNSQ
jgi:hypothetical protein